MTLRVGIIGAGAMGAAHARMLRADIAGAAVHLVNDADPTRAGQVAEEVGGTVADSPAALIERSDAVVIASPDFTHAELVALSLEAGKPVLCEKPLSPTVDESAALVEQETALGKRLVQVGFMRRFDPGLVALREATLGGDLGTVRMVHCVHRNAVSTTSTSGTNLITGSMIHELDQLRWLLGEDLASIEVRSPVAEGFQDPQLATVQMQSGALVTIDVFVNAAYGYDVRCEVVGTKGTASADLLPGLRMKQDGVETGAVPADFVVRFGEAYRRELSDWVMAATEGTAGGASTWDGHLANVAAASGVQALLGGGRVAVPTLEAPDLYR